MAGDWIKFEHATPRKPEVFQIAAELGIDTDTTVGLLIRFWVWVSENLSEKCPEVFGHAAMIDAIVGRSGFAEAAIRAGWLHIENNTLSIPNYAEHLSETAKKRAEDAKRKRFERKGASEKCPKNVQEMSGKIRTKNGLEKRREEKKREDNAPPNPLGDVIVTDDIAERIYAAYPRKVAKPAALKAIRKALESIDGDSLLALTEAYSEARRGQDMQYTPHPATWFNGQRWADDPQTWRTDDKKQPDLFGGIRDWLEETQNGN